MNSINLKIKLNVAQMMSKINVSLAYTLKRGLETGGEVSGA